MTSLIGAEILPSDLNAWIILSLVTSVCAQAHVRQSLVMQTAGRITVYYRTIACHGIYYACSIRFRPGAPLCTASVQGQGNSAEKIRHVCALSHHPSIGDRWLSSTHLYRHGYPPQAPQAPSIPSLSSLAQSEVPFDFRSNFLILFFSFLFC
jgi:hypothetical protein